ncbi:MULTISPECIES: aldehyde dehydrogenase family protein [Pseudomonas fluorescens group]|uniref:Aldehyde dehydrogenase family protein n=2 Tax=Pseudomonas petroselini TaxID=2899822 RepID=A0ABS8QQA8_9PSED|nr:aldehyde dehydrogenase family protein [Pseudomonas petroselini]MCD7047008.1 aldehyde dehydrogenase family protein [Pseudomonas petroselini]MCD7067830.1 aldehyde dehydrogenase family protein [Pseudomonas petroselini]MCM2380791.1 aldehyde dehydrogenase family protein [Pseudomonas marginalis]
MLLNPPIELDVMQKEVFGPLIAVYAFEQLDEAIELANALPFALQAVVFTQSLDAAMRCYQRIDATAVIVKENILSGLIRCHLPARWSGHGVGGIPHT